MLGLRSGELTPAARKFSLHVSSPQPLPMQVTHLREALAQLVDRQAGAMLA